jgi:hypothetical protein
MSRRRTTRLVTSHATRSTLRAHIQPLWASRTLRPPSQPARKARCFDHRPTRKRFIRTPVGVWRHGAAREPRHEAAARTAIESAPRVITAGAEEVIGTLQAPPFIFDRPPVRLIRARQASAIA